MSDDLDQDALAAEWEAMAEDGDDLDLASEWEAMVGGGDDDDQELPTVGGGPERILNQDEIDSLLAEHDRERRREDGRLPFRRRDD